MDIIDAIYHTSEDRPYITRESWHRGYAEAPKILATNTPDCCVIFSSASRRTPCRGWQPRAEDLIATDWTVTGG